jgi:hypothetical protein
MHAAAGSSGLLNSHQRRRAANHTHSCMLHVYIVSVYLILGNVQRVNPTYLEHPIKNATLHSVFWRYSSQ